MQRVGPQTQQNATVLCEKFSKTLYADLTELEGVDVDYIKERIVPPMKRAPIVVVFKGGEVSSEETTRDVKVALTKALSTLGYPADQIEFLRIGVEAAQTPEARKCLTEKTFSVVDPELVVIIDAAGAELLGLGGDLGDGDHEDGAERKGRKKHVRHKEETTRMVRGTTYIYVGDFEEALNDDKKKQRSWALLKTVKRVTQIY